MLPVEHWRAPHIINLHPLRTSSDRHRRQLFVWILSFFLHSAIEHVNPTAASRSIHQSVWSKGGSAATMMEATGHTLGAPFEVVAPGHYLGDQGSAPPGLKRMGQYLICGHRTSATGKRH